MNTAYGTYNDTLVIGVCKALPADARQMLVKAAETRSLRAIDAAIDYARTRHPQFFQPRKGAH